MPEITPEQREAALRTVTRTLVNSDPEGLGGNFEILLCDIFDRHPECPDDETEDDYGWKPWVVERGERAAVEMSSGILDALIAEGWGPDTTRARAEADLAEHRDAMAEARQTEPASGETVEGAFARLRREALVKAGWCEAAEDWIGVVENLAQADAYEYAAAGPVGEVCAAAEARGYRAGVKDAARECRRVAAEVLQGQVRPGQPRRVVTRPMARMAIRCAQRIRALADKPKETPHGR